MDLLKWLYSLCGPGRQFASPRQLSLAASGRKNQNLVGDLETRGLVKIETAQKLAEATGVSTLRILMLAGVITPEQAEEVTGKATLSPVVEEILNVSKSLPEREQYRILRVMRALLAPDGEEGVRGQAPR